jgi:hypothetical protein
MSKASSDVVVEDTILLEWDLTYKAYLVKILEQQDRVIRRKMSGSCTPGTVGHQLWPKTLDTTSSL